MAKAKASEADTASESRTFVKYTAFPGIHAERTITKDDWESIGIDHDSITFDRSNRFQIDATDLPEDVLEYFKGDDDFKVSSKDSPPALADGGSLEDLSGTGSAGGTGLTGGGSTATSAGGAGSTGAV